MEIDMTEESKKGAQDSGTEKLDKLTKKRRDTLKSLALGSGAVATFQSNSNWTKPVLKSTILPAHGAGSGGTIACTAFIRTTEDGSGGEDYNEGLNTFDPGAFSGHSDNTSNDLELVVNATLTPPLSGQSVSLNIDQVSSDDSGGGASDFDGVFSDASGGVGDTEVDAVTDGGGTATFTPSLADGVTDMGFDGDDSHDGGTITLTVSSEGYSPCEIIINVPTTEEE
jgi:hypothetical protein